MNTEMPISTTSTASVSPATSPAPIVVLITKDPIHGMAKHALDYVRLALQAKRDVKLFFYADGAMVANALRWQPADRLNITHEWQQLAGEYDLALKVCVSTALARGITDEENAQRHNLVTSNLANGFTLVGLTDLMIMMDNAQLVQF